jgi:hypothetical protein
MTKISLCFLILMSLFLTTGCPKYRPKVDFENPSAFISKLNAHIKSRHHDYECYRFGPTYPSTLGSCAGYALDLEKAKGVRNELLEGVLPYIDSAYLDFITDLQAGRDRTNFIADVVELGTTAAVGITNGERSLQILGVALTAFRGGRRSADLNFYKEQTTPVLITKMDGNRAKVRATILTRETAGADDYPMGAAISDIVDYYNAGTLVRAFTELQKDTADQTKESEDNVIKLKGVLITGVPTPEEHDRAVAAQNSLADLFNDLNGNDATRKAVATKRLQLIAVALEGNKEAADALKEVSASSKDDGATLYAALVDIRMAARVVNNRAILKTINQAINDEMARPAPVIPAASPTPKPSPAASPNPGR